MFEKILVPLDGTDVAEAILPYVSLFASGLGSSVVLVTVLDPHETDLPGEYGDPDSDAGIRTAVDQASADLEQVAERLRSKGISTEVAVRFGRAAESILEAADSEGCSLIALSTHGRNAITRAVLGSVTDKVIHGAHSPVLTITPDRSAKYHPGGAAISKIMVPLDGSPLAESVLPYAEHLSRAMSLDLLLVRVMRTGGVPRSYLATHPYETSTDIFQNLEADLNTYLTTVAGRIKSHGVSVETLLLKGAPAVAIVDLTRDRPHDIILMATHGRSGVRRWILGSVSETVVRASGDPVLVVPAQQA